VNRAPSVLLPAVIAALLTASPAPAAPRPFSAQTIDGPSAAITGIGNVTLARDGTGNSTPACPARPPSRSSPRRRAGASPRCS